MVISIALGSGAYVTVASVIAGPLATITSALTGDGANTPSAVRTGRAIIVCRPGGASTQVTVPIAVRVKLDGPLTAMSAFTPAGSPATAILRMPGRTGAATGGGTGRDGGAIGASPPPQATVSTDNEASARREMNRTGEQCMRMG